MAGCGEGRGRCATPGHCCSAEGTCSEAGCSVRTSPSPHDAPPRPNSPRDKPMRCGAAPNRTCPYLPGLGHDLCCAVQRQGDGRCVPCHHRAAFVQYSTARGWF